MEREFSHSLYRGHVRGARLGPGDVLLYEVLYEDDDSEELTAEQLEPFLLPLAQAEASHEASEEQDAAAVATSEDVGKRSVYRGVCWHKVNRKWEARFYLKGKMTFLGYFDSEEAAALR